MIAEPPFVASSALKANRGGLSLRGKRIFARAHYYRVIQGYVRVHCYIGLYRNIYIYIYMCVCVCVYYVYIYIYMCNISVCVRVCCVSLESWGSPKIMVTFRVYSKDYSMLGSILGSR